MLGNIISVNYNVIEKKDKNLIKIKKRMELAIKNASLLTSSQIKGVTTALTRRLKEKLIESTSKNGGKNAGIANTTLYRSIKYDIAEKKNIRQNTKSGLNEIVYSFNLNMEDYGFIIGADNFMYYPKKEDAISWIKAKQRQGQKFYIPEYKTVKGKKEKVGERAPRGNKDLAKLAYIFRQNVKQPTIAIPNWYKLNDSKSKIRIDKAITGVANLQAKKLASEINKK